MRGEGEIQKTSLELVRQQPNVSFIERTQSGKVKVRGGWMQLCKEGTPDAMGMMNDGRFLAIEFKDEEAFNSKNHGASDEQLKRLNKIKDAGGYCGIACCEDHAIAITKGEYIGL